MLLYGANVTFMMLESICMQDNERQDGEVFFYISTNISRTKNVIKQTVE